MSDHTSRARLLFEQNRYKEAEKYARSALEEDPENSESMAIIALCLSHEGRKKAAMRAAEDAISLDPNSFYPHYVQACIAHDLSEIELSIEASKRALEIDPDIPDCYGILANCYLRKKNFAVMFYLKVCL